MKEQSLAEGSCTPVDIGRAHQKTASFSFILQTNFQSAHTVFIVRVSCLSPWSLTLCDEYGLATRMLQTAHLPILTLTAILYVAAKEQPDVTSCKLNCNTAHDLTKNDVR